MPDEKQAAFDAFAEAVGRYGEALGWVVVVVGSTRIQQQPEDAGTLRFELVVKFTGRKREES